MFPSAANLATYDASAVSACGPRFRATCPVIEVSLLAACLFASSKILSVSTCASRITSSIPISKCCGIGVCVAWVAGANVRGGPLGAGCVRCVCGSPRVAGCDVCVRGGPCGDCCITVGGFTNVCPWCGPG